MRTRLRPIGALVPVLLTGALLAALATEPAAQAATAPGWRIVQVSGPKTGVSQLMSVDAVGAGDAWLTGVVSTGVGPPSLSVEHWNGRAWQPVPPPPGTMGAGAGVVAASSATDSWVFAGVSAGSTDYTAAARWNGSRWSHFRFPSWSAVSAAAVFSRTNAWAFGQIFVGKIGPYVARYNGKRWRRVSVPVSPLDASAVSARDIWAVGQTVKSLSHRQVYAAMHWNGRSWRTLGFPRLREPKGVAVQETGIQAFSPRDVWVIGVLSKGMGLYPGQLLLHWKRQPMAPGPDPVPGLAAGQHHPGRAGRDLAGRLRGSADVSRIPLPRAQRALVQAAGADRKR